jgi:hypothetical protein
LLWSAEGELASALEAHAGYVAGEVLATSFTRGALTTDATEGLHEADVDGGTLRFLLTAENSG